MQFFSFRLLVSPQKDYPPWNSKLAPENQDDPFLLGPGRVFLGAMLIGFRVWYVYVCQQKMKVNRNPLLKMPFAPGALNATHLGEDQIWC